MPVIQCDIRAGRSAEQKQAMAREITRAVHETIGAPVEYIYGPDPGNTGVPSHQGRQGAARLQPGRLT